MEWFAEYGYIGLFFWAFLSATIIPLSSDLLLIALLMTGADPIVAVISATMGNWLGGLSSYGLGRLGKWEWIERLGVTEEKLEKQRSKIERYGAGLAFLSWLPIIGDIFAIALGFYRVDFKKTAIFMLIGKSARFIMWAVIYYYVSPHFHFLMAWRV